MRHEAGQHAARFVAANLEVGDVPRDEKRQAGEDQQAGML